MTLTSLKILTTQSQQGMKIYDFTVRLVVTSSFRVIVHGFWNSHTSRVNRAMKEVYLNDYDVNLIIVNYSRVSRDTCYKIARSRVKLLGEKIAMFLDSILGDDEWQWRNLVIVGHSLGCHTAGGKFKQSNISQKKSLT